MGKWKEGRKEGGKEGGMEKRRGKDRSIKYMDSVIPNMQSNQETCNKQKADNPGEFKFKCCLV